jgi:uncharacterized NAD-dependent epimerase/dehydratase family protein
LIEIDRPYLLFLGDAPDQLAAKTADGIARWRGEHCVGQFALPACAADLGLDSLSPREAAERGARTMVIGVASRGGAISPDWQEAILEALEAGLDIASGLHDRVARLPPIAKAARRLGRQIHDVRHPTEGFPVATGVRRPGRRVLTIGTDCSIGKMFTALAIDRELARRGVDTHFRATGQTGILIAGTGISIDAVVADFMAGAVESLCPAAAPDHWDVVEGQASLFHPSYAGVTLALLHGAQPDAMVLCHEPERPHQRGLPGRPLPYISDAIALHERCGRVTNPRAMVVGISLNTARLSERAAAEAIRKAEDTYGLPCGDPLRGGVGRIVSRMLELFP